MKNQTTKFNKSKLVARVMLVVFLMTGAVSLTSCIFDSVIPYDWEVYSHEEFVKQIETYYSLHDLFVGTFISFDLDDNDEVSKRVYFTGTMANSKARGFNRKHGYVCDLYADGLAEQLLFYLKSDGEQYSDCAYKIKCTFKRVDFNYNEKDKIEIAKSECRCSFAGLEYDLMYEESLMVDPNPEDAPVYNYMYHYSLYVNDTLKCNIHISSIEEASEEKLNEIIQMLLDNMVILNPKDFFIWRDMK